MKFVSFLAYSLPCILVPLMSDPHLELGKLKCPWPFLGVMDLGLLLLGRP